MLNELQTKLENKLLDYRTWDEADVVYLLIQIQKYIEKNFENGGELEVSKQKDSYKYLKFYRDWVCHSKKSKNLDKFLSDLFDVEKTMGYGNTEFTTFENVSNDLNLFINEFFPTVSYTSDFNGSFVKLLSSVLVDLPIEINLDNPKLKNAVEHRTGVIKPLYITKFVYYKDENGSIKWKITVNGKDYNYE
jgi:hypothetical protein